MGMKLKLQNPQEKKSDSHKKKSEIQAKQIVSKSEAKDLKKNNAPKTGDEANIILSLLAVGL